MLNNIPIYTRVDNKCGKSGQKFIYFTELNMVFTEPIFAKLTVTCKIFVGIPNIEFCPNWTKIIENMLKQNFIYSHQ